MNFFLLFSENSALGHCTDVRSVTPIILVYSHISNNRQVLYAVGYM
jgi:hypothetical protein